MTTHNVMNMVGGCSLVMMALLAGAIWIAIIAPAIVRYWRRRDEPEYVWVICRNRECCVSHYSHYFCYMGADALQETCLG